VQLKKDIEGQGQGHLYPEILKELQLCHKFNTAIASLQEIIKSPQYQIRKNAPIKMIVRGDWCIFVLDDTESKYSQLKPIHKNLYEKLKMNYNSNNLRIGGGSGSGDGSGSGSGIMSLDALIISLVIRYEALESGNQQLAVNPKLYSRLSHYGFAHELFASGLNSFCSSYCSLFPDIEQYFGSKGNFDDFKILSGKYFANPPFDEAVTKNMAVKLIDALKSSNEYIAVFITLPAWDKFEALSLLENSGFMSLRHFVPKSQIKFFHYYENKYIDAVNTYFILIENKKSNLSYAIKNDLRAIFPNNKAMVGGDGNDTKKYFSGTDINKNIRFNKIVEDGTDISAETTKSIIIVNKEQEQEQAQAQAQENARPPLLIKIKHAPSDMIIKSNIKFAPFPPKYLRAIVEKFYLQRALNDAKRLNSLEYNRKASVNYFSINNNITTALSLVFPEGLPSWPMNIMLIDLTYSCEHFTFIQNRLRECYIAFANFITKTAMFQMFNIQWCVNPRYHETDFMEYFTNLHEEKLNFIFVSGNLDYYMTKSISFYTEQISYILYLAQTYIVLANQAPGGSFIYFFYSCDSPIFRQMINILQNSYTEIYLFNLFDGTNNSYIIGKDFIGISPENLATIKETLAKLLQEYPDFGESFNIYSDELRKRNHVIKHITWPPKDIKYLSKVFDLHNVSNRIYKKINAFHDIKYGQYNCYNSDKA
jgi:hypothetical protein